MRIIKTNDMNFFSFLLFSFGFLLFWEWLRPLQQLTPLDIVPVFLLFSLLVFVISFLHVRAGIAIPIYVFSILFTIHTLHFTGSFFNIHWFLLFVRDVLQLIESLLALHFYGITDTARTLLFLILFCLVGTLMRQWLLQRRNIFPFLFMTVIYVTVIDTFTPYDASLAIVRIVIIGFTLVGMLRIANMKEQEGFHGRMPMPATWFALMLMMIATGTVIGFFAPKSAPQWADPVPFLKSAANIDDDQQVFGSVKKLGYSDNDEQLGGPFQLDTTPVFYAESEIAHYWRAETKDVYTGKGWVSSRNTLELYTGELSQPRYAENVQLTEREAIVEMTGLEKFPFLFYAGSPWDITVNENPFMQLFENRLTGKISTQNEIVEQYHIRYDYPTFALDALKESDRYAYPEDIVQDYLQLPESLPARVQELAEEVTREKTTNYEKVKAIEGYFSSNDYTYETRNVAIPGRDEDYVDQFLFETRMGYCDNFSTAMAVMLRSIGIPARWAKGFTDGELQERLSDGTRRHLITNEHAHSWVEVYFPNVGWVPFEPTRGFSNPVPFVNSFDAEEQSETDVPDVEEEMNEEQAVEQVEQRTETEAPFLNTQGKGWWLAASLVGFLLIGLLLYKYYRPIAKKWVIYRLAKKPVDRYFNEWYERLLWLLALYGFTREPGQTLREFAVEVDQKLGIESMVQLTKVYERTIYAGKKEHVQGEVATHWQNVVHQLSR